MKRMIFSGYYKKLKGQRGEILLTTLIFVLLGFTIIVPLVAFMGTGLKTGKLITQKSNALYAADAGIEDAIWQIKYDRLEGTFINRSPVYDRFDFQTPSWAYDLPRVNAKPQLNNHDVTVAIRNVWVPQNVATPTKAKARAVLNTNKLLVTGGAFGVSSFNIVLTYHAAAGENLTVKSVGVWLPPGFTYIAGSGSLEANINAPFYSNPGSPVSHQGGQVVIWNFNDLVFTSMPNVKTTRVPMTTLITFDYIPSKAGTRPDGVAWVTTGNVDLDGDGVSTGTHFAWDSDVRVFGIKSTAGPTTVETYVLKSEMRVNGGSVPGSYFAAGDTLMIGPASGRTTRRDGTVTVGPPTVQGGDNGIPDDANISKSYLYWSAWRGESGVTRPLNDGAASFANWTNGGAWSVDSGVNFIGHYSGGADSTSELVLTNSINMSAYAAENPAADTKWYTALSWEQWVSGTAAIPPLDPDTCANFNNWDTVGSNWAWTVNSGRFRGNLATNKDLVLKAANKIDLRLATPGSVTVSWDQRIGGSPTPDNNDGLDYSFSANGTTFPVTVQSFRGNIGTTFVRKTVTIPNEYLTANFRIRFSVVGFSSTKYCEIDNISVTASSVPTYSADDNLQIALSRNGGTTWSEFFNAFDGTRIGSSPWEHESIFQYNVPRDYLTANFKFKLRINGFGNLGQYVGIDNIRINCMQPHTTVPFRIQVGSGPNQQVYLDSDGLPQAGAVELDSKLTQCILAYYNNAGSSQSPTPAGYAYSCKRDITALVVKYAKQPVAPATNYNGHATYRVINGTAHPNPIGDTGTALSFAGFSIVHIFTSAQTQSHQIYLLDTFNGSGQKAGGGLDVAFDYNNDGQPDDTISGFVVPQRIGNEVNSAKITCFVVEGDVGLSDDYFAINGTKLWDGTISTAPSETGGGQPNNKTTPRNVWNGQSLGVSNDGVDIDTLGIDPTLGQYVTWDSQILKPGDTEAQITIHTRSDYWFMCYMILAFRSETTTGGSLTYLIKG